jgi:hypothetical protein
MYRTCGAADHAGAGELRLSDTEQTQLDVAFAAVGPHVPAVL